MYKFFIRNITTTAVLLYSLNTVANMQLLTSIPSSNNDLSGSLAMSGYDGYQRRDNLGNKYPSWNSGSKRQPKNRSSNYDSKKRRRRASCRPNSNKSDKNTSNIDWKSKYDSLMVSYASFQAEYNKMEQINISLQIKIKEYESNAGSISDLKLKIQKLEFIIEDLKAKLSNAEKDACKWKSQYDELLVKVDDYKSQIIELNLIIVDLKNQSGNSSDCKMKLDQAFKKIADLQTALDNANARIKKLMGRHHGHGNTGDLGYSYDNSLFVGASLNK